MCGERELESKVDTKAAFNQRIRLSRRKTATRHDHGLYAMWHLNSVLFRSLGRARQDTEREFFIQVGFLFVDWDLLKKSTVSSESVRVAWLNKTMSIVADTVIPEVVPQSVNDPLMEDKNRSLLQDLVKGRVALPICVQNDVVVVLDKGRNGGGESPGPSCGSGRDSSAFPT